LKPPPLRLFSNPFAILGLLASILGLTFAVLSSIDYARHLDRHLHDVHCSLVPGLTTRADDEENPCRAAMYSAYAAVFRGALWGGVPISLFAVGAFSFFLAFSLYLWLAGPSAPKTALGFFAAVGLTPLAVSVCMFVISLTKLGALCKTCVGIYLSSVLLAVSALLSLRALLRTDPDEPVGSWIMPVLWSFGLVVSTFVPSVVYAASVPDERPFLAGCGKLQKTVESHNALIKMKTPASVRPALLFEDPLCPTCRAFHQRMVAEGAFDRLDVQMSLLPLDSECNWMLTTPLHPGACTVSKAVICAGDRARDVLEWAYEEQDDLLKSARAGDAVLRGAISKRWGNDIVRCLDATSTKLRLNQQLHFAADNSIPVSTPQMYLGDQRICDEDTDLGLRYTLAQLAPEVVP
jgi:uncharacterized membrane protein